RWTWLAALFALLGGLAGFGIGNMVQANSMAQALESNFAVDVRLTGFITMPVVAVVILGGIRRIGKVAASLVPLMCVVYVLAALAVLIVNFSEIPAAFSLIFAHAFTPAAATGGFAGAAV